jgi:hypothetical protein
MNVVNSNVRYVLLRDGIVKQKPVSIKICFGHVTDNSPLSTRLNNAPFGHAYWVRLAIQHNDGGRQ